MGEVTPGDYVLNEEGAPSLVKWCSPPMWRQTYRVGFSDGATLIADGEHLWTTLDIAARSAISRQVGDVPQHWATWKSIGRPIARDSIGDEESCTFLGCTKPVAGRGLCGGHFQQKNMGHPLRPLQHPCPGAQTRTTLEISKTLTKGSKRRETNHAIPATDPLDLQTALLPVDPYLLGVWLGDGTSAEGHITCALADREIIDHIEEAGYTVRTRIIKATTARFVVAGLRKTLRLAGLLNNKHIPHCYLRASSSQRRALLQGLMDSDGSADRRSNQCEFTSTKERIADGFYELATSLGIIARMKEGRAKLYGRDIGPKWRIFFTPPFVPFRLARKVSRMDLAGPRKTLRRLRFLTAVEPNGWAPVRCIAVDSPSALYLAGKAMIPTHNSTVASIMALHTALYAPPPALVLLVSPSLRQSAELFRKVRGFLDVMPSHPRLVEDNKLSLQFVSGGRVVSLPGAEKTARGFSAATLILEDEASRVLDEFNMAIRPMLAVGGGSLVLMSTPFGARGHFHDAYVNGNQEWKRVKVTAHDCPRITPEFLEEERRIIGDWWFKQEWLCEFVEALDSVFSFELIMKAMSDEVQPLFGGVFVG